MGTGLKREAHADQPSSVGRADLSIEVVNQLAQSYLQSLHRQPLVQGWIENQTQWICQLQTSEVNLLKGLRKSVTTSLADMTQTLKCHLDSLRIWQSEGQASAEFETVKSENVWDSELRHTDISIEGSTASRSKQSIESRAVCVLAQVSPHDCWRVRILK